MKYHEFRAMNTGVLLAADGEGENIDRGFLETERLVRNYEKRFTRFSEDSELSALNRSNGEWTGVSPDLFELVQLAVFYYHATGGLFNPAILRALEGAGYDRSIDEIRKNGSQVEPAQPVSGAVQTLPVKVAVSPVEGFEAIRLDPDRMAIRLPPGVKIDLGGIAKGWIAEKAARWLNRFAGASMVDAGGDLFACGALPDAGAWDVAIEDPFDPNRDLTTVQLGAGAIATSTTQKRKWLQDGQPRHHLIDPRTGLPAETSWVSVTVISDLTTHAEVLAKAVLIAGKDGSNNLIEKNPDSAFIIVDTDGQLWGSENSRRYFNGNNA